MKLIIAGSRTLNIGTGFIESSIRILNITKPTEIVCGMAKGVDYSGFEYAKLAANYPLTCKEFPADWDKNGRAAGPIRNKQMADYADALLLIWDGESKGSANMKENMLKLNKPVYEVILKRPK